MNKNYYRLIRTRKAEQILGKSNIHIDTSKLNVFQKTNPSNEKAKYLLHSKVNGFISSEYSAQNKITARMFTKSGSLNLITLADTDIKVCINSRYDNGYIVELDYSSYEFGIMLGLLNFTEFNDVDIHTIVAQELEINRNDAKRIVYALIYGMSKKNLSKILTDNQIASLFVIIGPFLEVIEDYLCPLIEEYSKNKSVTNHYGRLIYPKTERNIFNNIIQSIGSDILIDTIIRINNLDKFNILFHRFDSLFFDINSTDLKQNLPVLIDVMKSSETNFNLQIGISIGKTLQNLKKLE